MKTLSHLVLALLLVACAADATEPDSELVAHAAAEPVLPAREPTAADEANAVVGPAQHERALRETRHLESDAVRRVTATNEP